MCEVTPAVPLGTGYLSGFDANAATFALDAAGPAEPAEPISGLLTLTPEARGGQLRRAALGLALLGGALLASFATRLGDGDGALASAPGQPAAAALVAPAAAAELPRPAPAPPAERRAVAPAASRAPRPESPLAARLAVEAGHEPAKPDAARPAMPGPTGRAPAGPRSIPSIPSSSIPSPSIPSPSIPSAAARPRPALPPLPPGTAAPARAPAQFQAALNEDLYDTR